MTAIPEALSAAAPSPPGLWSLLRQELADRPGRLPDALRITFMTLAVIVVSETFRVPLPAYSAYIVFFTSKEEKASTILTGAILTIAATLSILGSVGGYMISAGEPGLRMPLMAAIAFTGMFLSRVSPLGPASFAMGFVATISLSLIDIMPPIAPLPTEEILTRTVLWLWVVIMLPNGMVVLVNILTGNDPAELFRKGLERRIATAGQALLRHEPIREADAFSTDAAMATLLRHLKLAALLKRVAAAEVPRYQALAARALEFSVLASEWAELPDPDPRSRAVAGECGQAMLAISSFRGKGLPVVDVSFLARAEEQLAEADPKAALLLRRVTDLIRSFAELLTAPRAKIQPPEPAGQARRVLFVPDAFSNPYHVRYALKATLAIMTAYVTYNLLAWPEIRTCMITCFFVTMGSVGETMHRATLRLAGALIGGALGLGTVIFVMPHLDSIFDLCLVVGVVTFIAAWVSTSSERLSYAGYQIALAFFMSVLVGYGPTIDMTIARDRVVGILLGNVIVFAVFTLIWPVSIFDPARKAMGRTLGRLADISRQSAAAEDAHRPTPSDSAYFAFDSALSESSRLLAFDWFDRAALAENQAAGPTGPEYVRSVQSLLSPLLIVHPILGAYDKMDHSSADAQYFDDIGEWLSNLGESVAAGGAFDRPPPSTEPLQEALRRKDGPTMAGRLQWLRELDGRARALQEVCAPLTRERNLP